MTVLFKSSKNYVGTSQNWEYLQGWLHLHFTVLNILLTSFSRSYFLREYYQVEEISCGIGMNFDTKWMISKHLSVGVENTDLQEMNLEHKQNCLVSIPSIHCVIHGYLVSAEFSSTLENFAKAKIMSGPWQKSITCSCIWVWTTVPHLLTKVFLICLSPLESFRF